MCLDCTISISDIIIAAITAIPACLMAVFAFLQYRINKHQEKHQHTTTAIDYCKQLMEFFDACEKDWNKIEAENQKKIREAFENAVKEQKEGIPPEVQKNITLFIKDRDFLRAAVEICPYLHLDGFFFEKFLNSLSVYVSRCAYHMIDVLDGIRKIDLDLLNYHQILLIKKRISLSIPVCSFYLDSILHQIENIENEKPFTDSWREGMKNRLPFLSELADDISNRELVLSELYSDDYSLAEKEEMKKKFAKKTWDESKMGSHF